VALFLNLLKKLKAINFPEKRIDHIIKTLTSTCWSSLIHGLYEADKLLFCLQLALQIDLTLEEINSNADQTFIKVESALTQVAFTKNSKRTPKSFKFQRELNVIGFSSNLS
jgi:hypothetical protein